MPDSSAYCRRLPEFMSYLLPEDKRAMLLHSYKTGTVSRYACWFLNLGLARTTIGRKTQILWHTVDAFRRRIVSNPDK